jgi:phage gpG-like protein
MSDEAYQMNITGLEKIIKAFKGRQPYIRIGILGSKNYRSKSIGQSNASIGALHEFGSEKMPMRSFLRVPLSENLNKRIESSGALDKDVLADVVKQGTIVPWLKKIAVLAEGIVAEAFETGGFSKWPPWKTPGYKNEGGRILVDTGQLRDSITSDIKE